MADELMDLGDLAPVEISCKIGGKPYLLREADAAGAAKYRNYMMACTRMTDGKVTGVKDLADAEVLLVSLCLFHCDDKGMWVTVPAATLKSWPARVLKPLFDKAKEISQLDEKAPEDSPPGKAAPFGGDGTSA